MTDSTTITLDWKRLAQACGCLDIACLTPQTLPADYLKNALTHWQTQGNLGTLDYIDSRADILVQPFLSRPWAKAAIVLTFAPKPDPESTLRQLPPPQPGRPTALIAAYALNQDYHLTGQAILQRLQQELTAAVPTAEPPHFDLCVDTKPVMEKELAVLAHVGEKGLNSLVRNQSHGSRLHLAVAFTSLSLGDFIPPPPQLTPCDSCRKCLSICPNHAFAPEERFQVRRCRAWLSSEYRRPLTREQQQLLGNTLFGCGLCSMACPARMPSQPPLAVDPLAIFTMPAGSLRKLVQRTALEHAGTTLLKRNAAANLANQLTPEEWHDLAPKLLDMTHSDALKTSIQLAL